ncbi:MAG: ABC transporter permease [Deinococcus sp.]|nr:ABC transporter permease [Deinococcus sp.]
MRLELIPLVFATLRLTTPILLAALGGVFSYQVGLLNIALEGMMLLGAFAAVVLGHYLASTALGVLAAMAAGALAALLFAFFVIRLRANLIVAGLALNLLAAGATAYALQVIFGVRGSFSTQRIASLGRLELPLVQDIPLLGPALSGHGPLVYLVWGLVILTQVILYRTVFGLRLRSAGEHLEAALAAGIRARRVQYTALLLSGALSGLAGAQLSLGDLTLFNENMTSGRGFMGLAAVFFGSGRPLPVALAALIFGLFDALQIRLQGLGVPPQMIQMLPYVVIVLALTADALRRGSRGAAY